MQKIIVTGGLGFIGSNLIDLLLKKNFFIINLDKVSYSSNFYNVKKFEKNKNYRFEKCNLTDQNKLNKIINKYKPQGIFNLAAETHVDRSIDGPKEFINSNIIGVFNLLEVFKNYLIRLTSHFIPIVHCIICFRFFIRHVYDNLLLTFQKRSQFQQR